MQQTPGRPDPWHRTQTTLLALTLLTSALHFADNAYRLDLYPGPALFTPDTVLAAWLLIPLAAFFAYRSDARAALIAYATLGFAGLGHFWVLSSEAHGQMQMPLRCTLTIGAEALASLALIVCVLLRPRPVLPQSV